MTEKRFKLRVVSFLMLILTFFAVAKENNSELMPEAADVNRKTALLCLDRSKNFMAQMKLQDAYENAELGISYDSEIPDLWYMKAITAQSLNYPKADVIQMVATSLNGNDWIQWNRDTARVMYADLLSDTCQCEAALKTLDSAPRLTGSDADFIRAKSYYRLGLFTPAREIVENAKSLYPQDGRFPLLFLQNEQKNASEESVSLYVEELIKNITTWSAQYPEISLYAATFSKDKSESERLLKAYSASGLSHPLHTVLSLKKGIISEEKAFNTMLTFASGGLDFACLQEFAEMLESESVITQMNEWLTAFAGILIFDVNNDGIIDLSAIYERGRASFIRYDENQDGVASWQANCDFGVPYALSVPEEDITLQYGVYPSVSQVLCQKANDLIAYELASETVNWSPMEIERAKFTALDVDFFIPIAKKENSIISEETLISNSSRIDVPCTERENSTIRFTMLNGKPQSALYREDNKPYAFAVFSDGILKFRNVDIDNDGFYELTESYSFDEENYKKYFSENEEEKMSGDLFGLMKMTKGLYLSKTVTDVDKDGFPDYFEEFLPNGGRIASWDTDKDGIWNIRSTIEKEKTTSQFIHPVSKQEISVVIENGNPSSVTTARGTKRVYQDDFYKDVFWIGEKQDYHVAKQIINYFNLSDSPSVSIIDEINGRRLVAVYFGNYYFGELFDE